MSTNLLDLYWLRQILNGLIILLSFGVIGLVLHKLLRFTRLQTLIALAVIAIVFFSAQAFGLVHVAIF